MLRVEDTGLESGNALRFDLPESIEAIRVGRKTQTRRRNVEFWLKKKRGDRITIVDRGWYLGWGRVQTVWTQLLGDMTSFEADREGYDSLRDFLRAWQRLYGKPDLDEGMVVISFYDVHWSEA